MSVFVQLCLSLVYDLHLHRSGSQANLVLSCFKVARNSFEKPPTPRNPTMEERRATFCVFILNSMYVGSSGFMKFIARAAGPSGGRG